MSLINEALKKAQRSRSADPGDVTPTPGGARITKRGQPLSAKAIVLYAAGALVLFVFAVVGTVFVLNRPGPTATVAAAKPSTPTNKAPDANTPTIVAPVITVPTPAPTPEKPPEQVAEKVSETVPVAPKKSPPANDPTPAPPPKKAPEPVTPKASTTPTTAATPPPAHTPAPAAAPAAPDEKINAYLDDLRVTAVRIQGNDSRVMINERVFRLNDIVDRRLGLRLTKVETNQIIFTDANGVSYVKYF